MTSGAVLLATCFDGRVVLANRAGAELGFQPDGSAVSGNPYCVIRTPRGGPLFWKEATLAIDDP
jgi:hypothetical protein